ncbi:MAG: 2-dehydropantoate 2-reductase [Lachnospiraceae bacterium]|nr:2-dehydropantoate 2-reductase [Lachnospiraceae bacterium]
MEYLIIGAGGTGGCIGAYMTEAGKDVTMIARGAHLKAMQAGGLRMETTKKGNYTVSPVKVSDMEHYEGHPDVIFVCVKGYSLEETVPFIRRAAKAETVVIPLLNLYGTGGKLQTRLPELLVTDGCIYIAAEIREPGCLWQNGDIFRVVYGVREPSEYREVLAEVKKDLEDSGITALLSDQIQRDALQKFSYVSPAAACGQYYDAMAGDMQKPGEIRDTFAALIGEVDRLADAMGIHFEGDIVKTNLDILDSLTPEASTSMQRDVKKGKESEMDGLIFEVVRMAKKYGVELPMYEKIAKALKPL